MRNDLLCALLLPALFLPATAEAQDTVAPTTGETVGSPRGENHGNYNVVQRWEAGYRYSLVGGDVGKYRSDVNFRNGIRLLNSSLSVNSRDGHGKYFDEIVLTTQGLGNDPYESAMLRVQKNQLYRYDMHWRLNDYFNPGLATAAGLHLANLQQRWQDHELLLFPLSKFKVRAGYARHKEDGPSLSTTNLFDNQRGDIFTLFSNVKREFNAYRIGADVDALGFRLTFLRTWEFYKEDTPYSLGAPTAGLNTTDASTLTSFRRSAPIHGSTPSWLVTVSTERKYFAFNGRFTNSAGRRNFVQNENAIGTSLFGAANRLVITYGDARRPVSTGDANLTFLPTERITITNNTSVDSRRVDGNSVYQQFDLGSLTFVAYNFQFLGIRRIINSSDVHLRATKKLDLFGGYRYSNREIRSIQSTADPLTPFSNQLTAQQNTVHSAIAGLNWAFNSALRLHLEAELGRNDNPFYTISERNYHALDARLQYRKRTVTASAGYRQNYNNNSVSLANYSAHSRNYFGNFAWTARNWISLDAGYSRLHLDSAGGIQFFAGAPRASLRQGTSVYVSNLHAANLGVRLVLKKADLYAGYNITRDTGDGRARLLPTGTVEALLYNTQTFPLSFQTPLLRLTVPLTAKLKWNAGFQYYGYREDFGLYSGLQNYHATTGYTSLLWAF